MSLTGTAVVETLSHVLAISRGEMPNIAAVLGVQEQTFSQVDKGSRLVESYVIEQSALCWSGHGL